MTETGSQQDESSDADRARRLFRYLAGVQELKSARAVRDLSAYRTNGDVVWLHDLPSHEAVRDVRVGADGTVADTLLHVDRVPPGAAPEPHESLVGWVSRPIDDRATEPTLRTSKLDPEVEAPVDELVLALEDHPEVEAAFAHWLPTWRAWAERERVEQPVRELYRRAWDMAQEASSKADEMELVVGVGLLDWKTDDGTKVRRHLFTAKAEAVIDEQTGRVTFSASREELSVEIDMLDPGTIRDNAMLGSLRTETHEYEGAELDPEVVGDMVRRLAVAIDPDAVYQGTDEPLAGQGLPVVSWAPAIILRKRSTRGTIELLKAIGDRIESTGAVPAGVYPLIDPDRQPDPGLVWSETDGAAVPVDDEVFLPKPVNDRQLEVIRKVSRSAQTVVQGPPGTGKTHTAAALISHMLALGKRVLITAQTDRALEELRDKLPEEIRTLAVSVIGSSREDLGQLEAAARVISERVDDFDEQRSLAEEARVLAEIGELRARRAELRSRLVAIRNGEVADHEIAGYSGSLARIAEQSSVEAERLSWIAPAEIEAGTEPPVTNDYASEWLRRITDEALMADAAIAADGLLGLADAPSVEEFRRLVDAEAAAQAALNDLGEVADDDATRAAAGLPKSTRDALSHRLAAAEQRLAAAASSSRVWVRAEALVDVCEGNVGPWESRRSRIAALVHETAVELTHLAHSDRVHCPGLSGDLITMAGSVLDHIEAKGPLKVEANGMPRRGRLAPKVVKESQLLFGRVRVNDSPPSDADRLRLFLHWARAAQLLDRLGTEWPQSVQLPEEDTLLERLGLHRTELAVLDDLLALRVELADCEAQLRATGLGAPSWVDPASVRGYRARLEVAGAKDELATAAAAVDAFAEALRPHVEVGEPHAWATGLRQAFATRDISEYAEQAGRLKRLHAAKDSAEWCRQIEERLAPAMPWLPGLVATEGADVWESRVASLEEAWRWRAARAWMEQHEPDDPNRIGIRLDAAEDDIRRLCGELAALRAWRHAVAPDRLTPSTKSSLNQYVLLTRKFGKGTGKYRQRKLRQLRAALDECREAVPVWIMPIYRLAEQLQAEPDQFDVVIVDEASQAGADAIFLQYLAPKVVVIGDDKQVSPTVIVDRSRVYDLADQYLADSPLRKVLEVPDTSLFDLAVTVYGGRITLVEHRRCVPEIIGFSNVLAYEPDGIRLQPVRQYGSDRLEPIRTVHVARGHRTGSSADARNEPEADALVDAVARCCADPAYDGMTFGIISLQGQAQAKLIEGRLLERLDPDEWAARDLRCGDSASFQGAERDVVFLSMVAAASSERRLGAATSALYVQRYNVAVSRAKDQVWLFHSVTTSDLPNTEDVRNKLLEYCAAQQGRAESDRPLELVPDDEPVAPFDSLFEQRVYNRLVERGYLVLPQFEASGYRIDLVVQGAQRRLAVECDGDHWHGPDRYEADLGRQRDLERADWIFHRVRESAFHLDSAAAIDEVVERLEELGIRPPGFEADDQPAPSPVPAEIVSGPVPERGDQGVLLEEQPVDSLPFAAAVDTESTVKVPTASAAGPSTAVPAEVAHAVPQQPAPTKQVVLPSEEPADTMKVSKSDLFDDGEGVGQSPLAVAEPEATVVPDIDEDDESIGLDDGEHVDHMTELASERGFRPYVEWKRVALDDPTGMPLRNLAETIAEFVDAEGPVLVNRMFQQLNQAAGNRRLGRVLKERFEAGLSRALEEQWVVLDDPLDSRDQLLQTVRAPDQPEKRLRELGPRSLHEVPPAEVAAALQAARGLWTLDSEQHLRALLDLYGLKRLTAATEEYLLACSRLRAGG